MRNLQRRDISLILNKFRAFFELFSFRDLRNIAVGVFVVSGGLGLSGLTLYAHRTGDVRLAGISAGISLVFVVLILIFVVPPLARNASREASQMNLPFEFTIGGAVMLVLLTIVGFSAWNTGNNLLFLVLSFLIAAMFVGFFAGRNSLKKLDVKMRFPETIFAGEATPIMVSLTNRKRMFPAFSIVAEVRGIEREESIAAAELAAILPNKLAARLSRPPTIRRTLDHIPFVPRNDSIESKTTHIFPNRGRFLIKNFELSTSFPFGFFRHRRRLPARETELIVFPKLTPLESLFDEMALNGGKLASGKRGLGQDLLSLRDYRPNDDLRRIDWKATARTRHLTVREFAAEDERRVTVILDIRIPPDLETKVKLREKLAAEQSGKSAVISVRFEEGVALAASLLVRFADDNAEIRLVSGSEIGDLGAGRGHLHECLKSLAIADPIVDAHLTSSEPELDLGRILSESDDSYFILVTARDADLLSSEIKEKLKIIGF